MENMVKQWADGVRALSDKELVNLILGKEATVVAPAVSVAAPKPNGTTPTPAPQKKSKKKAKKAAAGGGANTEETDGKVLSALKANEGISAKALSGAVGMGDVTVRKSLFRLKEQKLAYQAGSLRFSRWATTKEAALAAAAAAKAGTSEAE